MFRKSIESLLLTVLKPMDGIFNVLRFNWLYLKIAKVPLLNILLLGAIGDIRYKHFAVVAKPKLESK